MPVPSTRRGAAVLLALGLCGIRLAATQQDDQPKDSSNSIWLAYVGEHRIAPRWNLHLEGQIFWNRSADTRELMFARPGVRREFLHGLSTLIAYAYFAKYPAITGATHTLGEHRLSEDIQWRHALLDVGEKRATLAHRVRAEQRFEVQESQSDHGDSWQYAERVRYRLAANVPLPGDTTGSRPDYVIVYNEVFVNVGPHSGRQTIGLNISSGAIGWDIARSLQFEVGYLLEYNPTPAGISGKYDHIVQINLNSTLAFSRRKPSQ